MKRIIIFGIAGALIFLLAPPAKAAVVDELLSGYQAKSGGLFSADTGAMMWKKKFPDPSGGQDRGCSSCHGADLRQTGKHVKTGKIIEAMAPSANAKRLTDIKFIEKWFLRNCKWAWGRECTAGEKGHLLMYLKAQ